ncbi:MAG TPA: dihydrodipicolinate synthase family protein [Bryobacteraceae bacterium]|nr:dihydrodipicolinate synthase family protein [Bryobacteraceae bacterium]
MDSFADRTPVDWNTVVAYPVVPFHHGAPSHSSFRKNAEYLIARNRLDGGRPRVLGFGGGSLIHHLTAGEQLRLVNELCQAAGERAVVVSGIVPNPLRSAAELLEAQMRLARHPDAFLLLPVNGIANPGGIYRDLLEFCNEQGRRHGARFFLYLRSSTQRDALARVARDCDWVEGVKIGTGAGDVRPVADILGSRGVAMWGGGDCCLDGIAQGARGHTSGVATLFAGASDELNNAYRRGDMDTAREIESQLAGFERIRFMEERAYNYSAVVAAARMAGFADIDCGDGGPFNAEPPSEIVEQIRREVEKLAQYH